MQEQGLRKTYKEIPVVNEKLLKETAALTNTSLPDVEDIITFTGTFVSNKIKEGAMEGVMLPYFGKFVPRKKLLQTLAKLKRNRVNGMDKLYRAVAGKPQRS